VDGRRIWEGRLTLDVATHATAVEACFTRAVVVGGSAITLDYDGDSSSIKTTSEATAIFIRWPALDAPSGDIMPGSEPPCIVVDVPGSKGDPFTGEARRIAHGLPRFKELEAAPLQAVLPKGRETLTAMYLIRGAHPATATTNE
jgi:hypothetical protein